MLDNDQDDAEEVYISIDTANAEFLPGPVTNRTIRLNDVIPSAPVEIAAEGPLSATELNTLRTYLERLGREPNWTPSVAQRDEINGYIDRLNRFGVTAEGEQRLAQLQSILAALGARNIARFPPAGIALSIYSAATGAILSQVGRIREAEYQNFKQQMGGTTGSQAATRYGEIQAGFRPEWVGYYWIRYQTEDLQGQINRR